MAKRVPLDRAVWLRNRKRWLGVMISRLSRGVERSLGSCASQVPGPVSTVLTLGACFPPGPPMGTGGTCPPLSQARSREAWSALPSRGPVAWESAAALDPDFSRRRRIIPATLGSGNLLGRIGRCFAKTRRELTMLRARWDCMVCPQLGPTRSRHSIFSAWVQSSAGRSAGIAHRKPRFCDISLPIAIDRLVTRPTSALWK